MTIDTAGKNIIKNFEGLRLHSYRDEAGVWTIGYGSTYYVGGRHVGPNETLQNEAMADVLLSNTLVVYDAAVNSLVKVPLTQNQHNALTSFTYNEGIGALAESTLLRKLNAGDYQGAAEHFADWNKITDPKTGKKVVSDTLVHRRAEEKALFLTH